MNNPNPFLPQGSFLEQKDKARTRVKIAVFFSISLSVVALMALLIQGCRKPNDTADTGTDTNSVPQLPTNPPDMTTASNTAMTPMPETNPPVTPPPAQPVFTPPPAPTGEDYTVIKGDTLAGIAHNKNVSLKAMVEANPGVDAKRLKIGQKLHVPAPTSAPTASVAPMAGATEATASGGGQTYKVKSGDNLTTIAKHFHVTIKAIQSANSMTTTSIKVGQTLKIPASSAPAPAPAPAETMPPPVTTAPAPVPAGH